MDLKEFIGKTIREFLIEETELKESYPSSWNIEEFKRLKTFNARIQYCQQHLRRISSGTSRIVYMVDNTKVLKLAKNTKGIAQNQVEIDLSNDYLWDQVVAEIYDYDENGLWLEMALAKKVTENVFKNIVGISFQDYCQALTYHFGQNNHNKKFPVSKPDNMDDMWSNDFALSMLTIMTDYDLPLGDLCKLNSYGVVGEGGNQRIVMIDYGLTNDVYSSYYAH